MFNAILVGRLTKDPEQRQTATGSTVVGFRIAKNNGKDKAGADKPATFVECSVFGKTGEFVMSYARKGARVCISGSLEVSIFTNKNTGEAMLGINLSADSVELIDWPDKDQTAAAAPVYPPQYSAPPAAPGYPSASPGYTPPPQTQYPTAPTPQPVPQPQRFTDARGDWEVQNGQWALVRPATQAAPPPPSAPPAAAPWSNGPL